MSQQAKAPAQSLEQILGDALQCLERMAKDSAARGHHDASAAMFYLAGYLDGPAPELSAQLLKIGDIYRGRGA